MGVGIMERNMMRGHGVTRECLFMGMEDNRVRIVRGVITKVRTKGKFMRSRILSGSRWPRGEIKDHTIPRPVLVE